MAEHQDAPGAWTGRIRPRPGVVSGRPGADGLPPVPGGSSTRPGVLPCHAQVRDAVSPQQIRSLGQPADSVTLNMRAWPVCPWPQTVHAAFTWHCRRQVPDNRLQEFGVQLPLAQLSRPTRAEVRSSRGCRHFDATAQAPLLASSCHNRRALRGG